MPSKPRSFLRFLGLSAFLSILCFLALVASACGGGASPTAPPAPATPPPPQERAIAQGTTNLRDGFDAIRRLGYFDTAVVPFTTSAAGLLKVTVDYSFVDTELYPALYRGSCSVELAALQKCELVPAQVLSRGKPYRVTVESLPSGQYTLAVTNLGLRAESVAYLVTLTN